LDSQKDEPGSHSEACPSLSEDGDHSVNIKVEEFSDVEDRKDPVPVTVVGIKVEHEVSCMSLCPLLGISLSYPELRTVRHISVISRVASSLSHLHLSHKLFLSGAIPCEGYVCEIKYVIRSLVSDFVTQPRVQYAQ
jgi:hypothetical protein